MRTVVLCSAMLLFGSGCATNGSGEPTREEVLERLLPSAVQIILERDGQRFRTGSGVVISARPATEGADCFVITSGHTLSNLSGREQVYALFGRHRGAGIRAPATLLALREDEDLDLALLRVRTRECFPAVLGRSPALGESIWVVAFPWGRNMTLVGGIVSQVNWEQPGDRDAVPRLMVDASVSYGASGGGVYESRTGRLVGVVEGYRTARVAFKAEAMSQFIDLPVPGETYVVPLSDIRRFLTETGHADLIG